MMEGWIALHRKIKEHWIFDDSDFLKSWVAMLMDANHADKKRMFNGSLVTISRGQLLFGLEAFSAQNKITIAKLRRLLKMLENEGMINRQKTNKFSLITITNYDDYQNGDRQDAGKEAGKQQASDRQSSKQKTTPEQCKQLNNTKNIPSESSEGVPDENPPDDSPPEKPKPSKLKFNDEHYQLAVELSCASKARFGNALKIKLDEWADAIRRLNELDGHSLPEIARLWRWIVQHERGNFSWADNCRTPMKLRQRKDGMQYFDIIQNQMTREVPHAGNQSHSGAGNDRPARRPSLVERMQQGAENRVRGGRDSPDCRDVDGETVAENGFPLRA
ncbi:MAG: hypothetical protein CMI02_07470 [Oceanospirillaceae bacterium]|nr:hypothetical protein [Oceanospirillaceae bacterium]